MVDTVIVNNLTDTLSVSVSKCEMALDTIAVQVTNKSDAVDTFCGMPIEVAQFIVPALISLLGALIVFGIGECWKSRREQKRKLKKYMSTSQTIRTYVEVLNVEADKLVWQIRKYMSDSIGNKSMLPNAIDFDNIAVACLKHYSVGELTLIYVTNRDGDIAQKSKYLNNVQSSIDYLSTVINEMPFCKKLQMTNQIPARACTDINLYFFAKPIFALSPIFYRHLLLRTSFFSMRHRFNCSLRFKVLHDKIKNTFGGIPITILIDDVFYLYSFL